ncbi:hypothetical protein WJX79_000584 [Trebouxia sp. C0005]
MSGVKQTRTTWALPQSLRKAQTVAFIPDVESAARGANFVALQGSLVRTDLWYEAALLSKLLYKSKNQHRSSKHFQYLSEVKQCMKLLQQLQLSDLVGDLNHLTSSAGVGVPASASLIMFGRANKLHVPAQQAGILVLQRLLAGCRLAVKTIPAAHAAAVQLLAQLSMTYFMPFCLTALAMVARIQVLVCQLLLDSIKAYNSLLPLVMVLPQQNLARTGTYPDLPHMLSCSWAAGVPTLSLIPHTDFPSFAAAAQAFHTTHYASKASQLASSFAEDFGRKIGRAAAPAAAANGEDIGEKAEQLGSPGDAALLVFEDRQTKAGEAEGSQALRYRHTLPSVLLGSQAGRGTQTDEAPRIMHSRLHRQSDRAESNKKRSREEASPDSGLDPQRRPQPTPALSQPLRPPQSGYQRSSQPHQQSSGSLAGTSHPPMASAGQASQQSSAKTLSSGVLPGTRLRTGKVPLGKAFGLGQKAANQPAFIRIGAEPAAALAGEAMLGHKQAVSKGDQDQYPTNTPVAQAPTSTPPNTQEIMKMLLGTK